MGDLVHRSHVEIIDHKRALLHRPADMLRRPLPADHGYPVVLPDLAQHLFLHREPVTIRFTKGDLLGKKPIPAKEQKYTQACRHPSSHRTAFLVLLSVEKN